jgi:hypothetical protein
MNINIEFLRSGKQFTKINVNNNNKNYNINNNIAYLCLSQSFKECHLLVQKLKQIK